MADRSDDIAQILEAGRRTRAGLPRSLWIIAICVAAVCAIGFAIALFGPSDPPGQSPDGPAARAAAQHREVTGGGLGTGLVIGAAVGIIVGLAIARQRRDHSSRSKP